MSSIENEKKLRNIILLLLVIYFVAIVTFFYIKYEKSSTVSFHNEKMVYHGDAVTSNGEECAAIGMDILKNHNGTAVDAMIATLFCEGVVLPESTGLGGGLVGTIYEKATGKVETIVARERAPLASMPLMFENVTSGINGILSIAVPGALKGYAEMHSKYGRVPWKVLIQPTINLCRSGHKVTKYFAFLLRVREQKIFASPSLREIFVNPKIGRVWKFGDTIKREKLAETLEIIAEEGVDSMYSVNGTIAKRLIQEFKELGGIITMDDLTGYKTVWQKPISTTLRGNFTLNTVPLPASGMILSFILNILNGFEPEMSALYLHQMAESFKYAYAKRSHLGDEIYNETFLNEFTNMNYADHIRELILKDNRTFNDFKHYGAKYELTEDHGTAHISVLSKNGDAVAVTSTINYYFGSEIHSRSTGIILNNQMSDFSTPGITDKFYRLQPNPANYIKPGKRPMSSMCPSIVIDKNGDAVFIVGAAGGSQITTTVAYIFARHVWMNETLKDAVSAKRIHHQLLPMEILHEEGFNTTLAEGLKEFGHKVVENKRVYSGPHDITGASVTAISRVSGHIEATFELRRTGSTEIN